MLPTPSDFVGESFVQVTTILSVLCSCRVVMMHVWIAAVGTVMAGLIVASVCISVCGSSFDFHTFW